MKLPSWGEPYNVDRDCWWLKLSVYRPNLEKESTSPDLVLYREGTISWSSKGGRYSVSIELTHEHGLGLYQWPQFDALSEAQDFAEEILVLDTEEIKKLHTEMHYANNTCRIKNEITMG